MKDRWAQEEKIRNAIDDSLKPCSLLLVGVTFEFIVLCGEYLYVCEGRVAIGQKNKLFLGGV